VEKGMLNYSFVFLITVVVEMVEQSMLRVLLLFNSMIKCCLGGGTCVIDDCTFQGCASYFWGGGIFVILNGFLNISRCSFLKCMVNNVFSLISFFFSFKGNIIYSFLLEWKL
jgi:hypothetical protein